MTDAAFPVQAASTTLLFAEDVVPGEVPDGLYDPHMTGNEKDREFAILNYSDTGGLAEMLSLAPFPRTR
jgi:hypothetical protein